MAASQALHTPTGTAVIKEVLDAVAPRASTNDPVGEKNKYAVKFADKMAEVLARDLGLRLRGIEATTKRNASSALGKKQLDVNFSTPHLGLALGISLKSVHLRDSGGAHRYTHNMKRNEEELRVEATGYHKRQPYAVMVGVLFLPFDSCDDGVRENSSSFGSWVRHLRPYGGRSGPKDDDDRFERIYIALYEQDGSDLRFFDTMSSPPKNQRPRADGPLLGPDGRARRLLEYGEFLDAVHKSYLLRNSADFQWADDGSDPLDVTELDPSGEEPQ
jgi:hypothetical protein